jgi:hypothetical protein
MMTQLLFFIMSFSILWRLMDIVGLGALGFLETKGIAGSEWIT